MITTINSGDSGSNSLSKINANFSALYLQSAAKFLINSVQTISTGSQTKVNFVNETMDLDNEYDPTTSKFTCKSAGLYLVYIQLGYSDTGTTPIRNIAYIFQNGGEVQRMEQYLQQAEYLSYTSLLNCAIGDEIEFYTFQAAGSTKTLVNDGGVCFGYVVKVA